MRLTLFLSLNSQSAGIHFAEGKAGYQGPVILSKLYPRLECTRSRWMFLSFNILSLGGKTGC